jgi:hypothetical protein
MAQGAEYLKISMVMMFIRYALSAMLFAVNLEP